MDRRVIRTKKAIRSAFISLLVEKDMHRITIKEIADRAEVDRKTVYNYYKDIHAILGEVENEMISHFEQEMYSIKGEAEPKVYFAMLADVVERDFEFYELLMRSNLSSFIEKATQVLNRWIDKALNKTSTPDEEKIVTAVEYITAGVFSAYRHWFQSDRKKPLKEFSVELCELVIHGLPTYFLR